MSLTLNFGRAMVRIKPKSMLYFDIFNKFKASFVETYQPIMDECGDNKEMQQKVFHDSIDAQLAFVTELIQTCYNIEGPIIVQMFKELAEAVRKAIATNKEVASNVSVEPEEGAGSNSAST